MTQLLSSDEMARSMQTLARQVAEAAPATAPLVVIGIRRRGEILARRLVGLLASGGRNVAHSGALDITLYRDDLSTIGPNAVVRGTEVDFDITGAWVVLVDDVIYTGRSIRAALDALTDLGRPQAIRLLALVDRGGRELPIQPDFVGLVKDIQPGQIVKVKVAEIDGAEGVDLV